MSVSTFLGWFAILEILVLKSRVSRFSWSLTLLAWCLEFWVPYPVAPLPRVALWFFSSLCGARRAPPDIWPRASVSLLAFDLLLAWSLRLWGDPCLGVQWLSFRVRVLCPLLRCVDVVLRDLPCSSVGGFHCPGPVNARIIAWENVFNCGSLGPRFLLPGLWWRCRSGLARSCSPGRFPASVLVPGPWARLPRLSPSVRLLPLGRFDGWFFGFGLHFLGISRSVFGCV